MWQEWDQKLAELEAQMLESYSKLKKDDALWEKKIKQQKAINANLKALFDRQIEVLSSFEKTNLKASKKEQSFFHWVQRYADKLSEQMQELLKVMHTDFWISLVYTRVVHGIKEKNLPAQVLALRIQSQLKLLKKNEKAFAFRVEKLKDEEALLSKAYKRLLVIKANKEALHGVENQKPQQMKQMASLINLKSNSHEKSFNWSVDPLVSKDTKAFFSSTFSATSDASKLFSSQSLLASFDVEDLTHSL